MEKKYTILILLFIANACSSIFPNRNIKMFTHPELKKARVLCTNCHSGENEELAKSYNFFNHTSNFINQHGVYASQKYEICEICHKQNFCLDCHTSKDFINPNLKNGERPDRIFPHKGDYIIRHRIDGKIMSGACFSCHGRKNNIICRRCHK
ncbi:cytochrome C [Candidatus Poribacteria bacterium]|nr:cytochrome C [Candidatus Poribacteria bacterium]